MTGSERTFHEVANIFPFMQGEEYESLKADIAANGLLSPIWLHPDNHTIIDGRNRYRACMELGIEPSYLYWDGQGSLVSFVVSLNLRRRHLDESQRSMVAAKIANMGEGRPDKTASIEAVSQKEAANILNVSRSNVQRAKAVQEHGTPELIAAVESGHVAVSTAAVIAQAPTEEQIVIMAQGTKAIVEASKKVRQKKADQRRKKRVEKINEIAANGYKELPGWELYPVIYADPPWEYEHSESDSREIENHYPTLDLESICLIGVPLIATPDAVLFLWATSPKLAEAMTVIKAWGFVYRTCMVWDKERIGMGYYARQRHELLLIATKGNLPVPEPGNRPPSVVRVRRDEKHSKKPIEFYEIIERMYPEYTKAEIFARTSRPGWVSWGNEV
jgi:N6-adenosine-specific RNA methylase IME4